MAYGKDTKPLVVGLPSDLKKGIEQIALQNSIAEAEVIRRICRYLLNNPMVMERVINPSAKETKTSAEQRLYRGINCNPAQYLD